MKVRDGRPRAMSSRLPVLHQKDYVSGDCATPGGSYLDLHVLVPLTVLHGPLNKPAVLAPFKMTRVHATLFRDPDCGGGNIRIALNCDQRWPSPGLHALLTEDMERETGGI